MEIIDVVDTAIKVGLGALISGYTTYKVTKLNHVNSTDTESKKNKREMLITCTERTDEYIKAIHNCIAALDGYLRGGVQPGRLSDYHFNDYSNNMDEPLLSVRHNLTSCHSRLNLIGESNVAKVVSGFIDLENDLRRVVIFERRLPPRPEMDRISASIRKQILKLNAAYNKAYESMF